MLIALWTLAHFLTGAILAAAIGPRIKDLFAEAGAVKQNYRQREVVNMMGFLFIAAWIVLMAVAVALGYAVDMLGLLLPEGFLLTPDLAMPLTILILGVGLFGMVDDLIGNRDATGFKGHLGQLLRGKLTTGALKALGIPIVAFYAVYQLSGGVLEAFGNALLIALFVNTLNLLDLRPGRALKLFIPVQALFLVYAPSSFGLAVAALLGASFVLIRGDLKEEVMLGDVGSNILGAILGFSFAVTFGWPVKLALVIVLVGLQLVTERYSLTVIIEKTPVLRSLDRMGRQID